MIQPFDKDRFDSRYADVFKPAIRKAGFEPYRVDQDPAVEVPIDSISDGIRNSDVVLVELTTDNPNVWFELGYALACGKPACLICSDERKDPYPFDVRHRKILNYKTRSSSDFEKLKGEIIESLSTIFSALTTQAASSLPPKIESMGLRDGLEDHESACLAAIAVSSTLEQDGMSGFSIGRHMETEAGFTRLAATLAIAKLLGMGLISRATSTEEHSGESYLTYRITDGGLAWLLRNTKSMKLRKDRNMNEDDIPF